MLAKKLKVLGWDEEIKSLYFGCFNDKHIVCDYTPIGKPIVVLSTNFPGKDNSRLRFDEILDAHIKKMGLDEGRLSPNSLCTGKTDTVNAFGFYAKATSVQLYSITQVVRESKFKSEAIRNILPPGLDKLVELSERGDKLLEVEHSTIEERMRPLRLVCRGSPIIVEYEDLGWSLE